MQWAAVWLSCTTAGSVGPRSFPHGDSPLPPPHDQVHLLPSAAHPGGAGDAGGPGAGPAETKDGQEWQASPEQASGHQIYGQQILLHPTLKASFICI